MKTDHRKLLKFSVHIALPTFMAMALFITSIFAIFIPDTRDKLMERKREMIRELTNSAWSVLVKFEKEATAGRISKKDAIKMAISDIKDLRYGKELKDYFWVTDMRPYMIMHPYRLDLNGTDLSNYMDQHQKKLFVEFVNIVKKDGSGYLDYMWQWKDDKSRIVPKLSYVKGFSPWGLIVGTGIYIEDVSREISNMTERLFKISIAIVVILTLLLSYILHQSMKIEHDKIMAQNELLDSEQKYKTLVEAATDGIMMFLNGKHIYSNRILAEMLGYSWDEFEQFDIYDIISADSDYFWKLMKGVEVSSSFETRLKKKDGEYLNTLVTVSNIFLMGKNGFILNLRDLSTSNNRYDSVENDGYRELFNLSDTGVFKFHSTGEHLFLECNREATGLLELEKNKLEQISFYGLIKEMSGGNDLIRKLVKNGQVKNHILQFVNQNHVISTLSVTIVRETVNQVESKFFIGTVLNLSSMEKKKKNVQELHRQLEIHQRPLNRPLKDFSKKFVTCKMKTSVKEVHEIMSRQKIGIVIIENEKNEFLGIVTGHDLKNRFFDTESSIRTPVYEIMSSPLITLPETALVFEALVKMDENKVSFLVVKNVKGEFSGIVNEKELRTIGDNSIILFLKQINQAQHSAEIIQINKRQKEIIGPLIDSGANVTSITRIITSISDAVLKKMVEFAVKELGPAPVPFAFLALGSEGRFEQTLATDQDNAILFEDVSKEKIDQTRDYFLKCGNLVCEWLNESGHDFCKGDVMAKNPRWCLSFSEWKESFSKWINELSKTDLMGVNIFFDFRPVYGNKEYTAKLRKHINQESKDNQLFLVNLTQNSLEQCKLPTDFWGNIVVESKDDDEYVKTFDIKKIMIPITQLARIYALQNDIISVNTVERLEQLFVKNVLNKSEYNEILTIYNYLLEIRLRHQAYLIKNGRIPDNNIMLGELNFLQHDNLKKIASRVSGLQNKLAMDFKI